MRRQMPAQPGGQVKTPDLEHRLARRQPGHRRHREWQHRHHQRDRQDREIYRQQPPGPAAQKGAAPVAEMFERVDDHQAAERKKQIDRGFAMMENDGEPARQHRERHGVAAHDVNCQHAAKTIQAG